MALTRPRMENDAYRYPLRSVAHREKVMKFVRLAVAAGALALGSLPASAAGVDKLYVLYCGEAVGADQSRWSPGVNVGVPLAVSDNCYLIHHQRGWFLWDTGLPDSLAATPDGVTAANGAMHVKRTKTLAAQLDELGVKPADIKGMAISHTHPDHIGNVELFPQVMLYVQKAEYEWPGENGKPRFNPAHPVTLLEGDRDVFGDGSVMIISTPGHMAKEHAQLWINHDKPQSDAQKKAPDYYE
jgi:N-acyl homoserine lactone hydrolase